VSRYPWLWPVILIISATIIGVLTLGDISTPLRAPAAFWFLLVGPGMAFVPFLRLKEWLAEALLAIALSIALDALVAGTMLYAGVWSPRLGLVVLVEITFAGVVLQLLRRSPSRFTARITPAATASAVPRPRISVGGVLLPEGLLLAPGPQGAGAKAVVILVGLLNDQATTGFRIVGWFYAAPGSFAETVWHDVAERGCAFEFGTDLLLLLDPTTQKFVLHTWKDGGFVPAGVISLPQMSRAAGAAE